jgi:hypothetical protein
MYNVIIAIKKLSHFCASCLKIAPAATLGEVVKQPKKNLRLDPARNPEVGWSGFIITPLHTAIS